MKKDPAALIYPANWLLLTKHMKAHERGWYINLIMHHYDQGSIPDDLDEICVLADVRPSEFALFQQSWEQTLKQMFQQNGNKRLLNVETAEIIKGRGEFKDVRRSAGLMSAFIKHCRANLEKDENILFFIKSVTNSDEIEDTSSTNYQHIFEQKRQLYIDTIKNTNTAIIQNIELEKTERADGSLILRFVEQYKENFDNDYKLDETVVKESHYTPEQLSVARSEFWNSKELDTDMMGKPYQNLQLHFLRWNRLNRERIKKETKIIKKDGSGGPSSTATNWG